MMFQTILALSLFMSWIIFSHSYSFEHSTFLNRFRGGYTGNQDNEYYDILGIKRTATEKEIKRAYREKAMKIHPDRGGCTEEFKKLAEAYEVSLFGNSISSIPNLYSIMPC